MTEKARPPAGNTFAEMEQGNPAMKALISRVDACVAAGRLKGDPRAIHCPPAAWGSLPLFAIQNEFGLSALWRFGEALTGLGLGDKLDIGAVSHDGYALTSRMQFDRDGVGTAYVKQSHDAAQCDLIANVET